MRVKHIKFKVNKPGEVLRFEGQAPLRKPDTLQELNWSLGLGPCGRWVESLEVDITLAVVTIKQTSYPESPLALYEIWMSTPLKVETHRDRYVAARDKYHACKAQAEIKTFIYKLEDVRGRIEAIEGSGDRED